MEEQSIADLIIQHNQIVESLTEVEECLVDKVLGQSLGVLFQSGLVVLNIRLYTNAIDRLEKGI